MTDHKYEPDPKDPAKCAHLSYTMVGCGISVSFCHLPMEAHPDEGNNHAS